MFEKTREKEEEERSAEQEQITIDEIENKNAEDNIEQSGEAQADITTANENQEFESNEPSDADEPSAEDDIIVD